MLLIGMSIVQPLWKTVWKFLIKLKIKLLHNPEIPLLGYIFKKTLKTPNLKRYTHPNNS